MSVDKNTSMVNIQQIDSEYDMVSLAEVEKQYKSGVRIDIESPDKGGFNLIISISEDKKNNSITKITAVGGKSLTLSNEQQVRTLDRNHPRSVWKKATQLKAGTDSVLTDSGIYERVMEKVDVEAAEMVTLVVKNDSQAYVANGFIVRAEPIIWKKRRKR